MNFNGKTVAVTGAGGGIGKELVKALLKRGAKVAAIDLRDEGMREVQAEVGESAPLSLHTANITDRDAVMALPEAIIAAHGQIDALINNAGLIQPFVDFNALDFEVIDRMISVNLMGTTNMCKAFLPFLLERPQAHLANVSSMGGFMPFPGQSMYGASKAGIKLLTEGLYAELADTNVRVSVIMPGAVNTDIVKNSGVTMRGDNSDEARGRALPANEAAEIMLDGIAANKLHIFVGNDARILNILTRIAPRWSIGFIQKKLSQSNH